MITLDDLKKICPLSKPDRLAVFVEPLNEVMREFDISTPQREAMFIAQLAHESGGFRYVRELASGDAYEGRRDLGNSQMGDGVKFKGRGLIQITGRDNYKKCGDWLGLDLINHPTLLEEPLNAARSAGWYWSAKNLNDICDRGDFLLLTKRINGGTNGYADRQAYFNRAQTVIA